MPAIIKFSAISDKKMVISRRNRSLIFLFIILAALLPLLLQIAQPFLTAFILASILAIAIHPTKERLRRRLRRPGLATFITTFAAVAVLTVLLVFAGITTTRELEKLYYEVSFNTLEEGGWPSLAATASDHIVDKLSTRFPIDEESTRTKLLDGVKTSSSYLLSHVGSAVSGVASFFFNVLLMTVFLYFFLRYGKVWIYKLAALTPLDRPVAINLLKTVHNSVAANVNGMLAAVVGQGILLSLGFWFTGVRSPVLWGTIGGFVSILPVVGSWLIWLPVAGGFLFMEAYGKALFLTLWGFAAVGSVDNVLRSFIVGKQGKQHPVLVALAAIGGAYAFGVLGILLGPLLIALSAALLKEIHQLSMNSAEPKFSRIPQPDIEKMSGHSETTALRRLLARRKKQLAGGGRNF